MQPKSVEATKKKIAISGAVAAFLITGGYYIASPYLALNGLKSAFQDKNAKNVNQYIDYPSVRESLKSQLMQKAIEDPQTGGNPLAMAFITPIINAMVDGFVTPAGMQTILSMTPDSQPSGDEVTQNIARKANEVKGRLKDATLAYTGLNTFQMAIPNEEGEKVKFLSERKGFADWTLKSLVIPL